MEYQPKEYYKKRISEIEIAIKRSRKILRSLGFSRLIIFLLLFLSIFFLIPKILLAGIFSTLVLIVLFLLLIKIYIKRDHRFKHLKALLLINQQELNAFDYQYSDFYPGNEFIDTEHPYSYDMDLFGEGSVFQYINRTVSIKGRKQLADWLSIETLKPEEILNRQIAIKELTLIPELTQDFRATGSMNSDKESDLEILEDWVNEPAYYAKHRIFLFLAKVLPVITILSFILAFFIPVFRGLAPAFYLVQFFIVGSRFSHTSLSHQIVSKRYELLRKYQSLFSTIEKGDYACHELSEIYATLVKADFSAAKSLKALTKIISAFDNRLNIVAALFLEGFLLWDIQCMIRLESWKKNEGSKLRDWINSLSRYDAFVSLATYAFNHPEYCYPIFDPAIIVKTQDLGHMLISPKERVCNNFGITNEGNFVLITGANMAGKSTFLRTIATNMILAMTGAPLCAKEFIFRPVQLFSSMRTSDSLNKHESYFYAELKRLKELLDRLKKGEKLFIILDEILKGTNSTDKQKGSRAALQQILELGGTGIIATHDLELATIEKVYPSRVKNICFEIEIDKAKISFDYKLKDGITTKMNALLLMEQMGIINS